MNESEDSVSPDKEATMVAALGETAGKWTVMGIMAIGLFMATLDTSTVDERFQIKQGPKLIHLETSTPA